MKKKLNLIVLISLITIFFVGCDYEIKKKTTLKKTTSEKKDEVAEAEKEFNFNDNGIEYFNEVAEVAEAEETYSEIEFLKKDLPYKTNFATQIKEKLKGRSGNVVFRKNKISLWNKYGEIIYITKRKGVKTKVDRLGKAQHPKNGNVYKWFRTSWDGDECFVRSIDVIDYTSKIPEEMAGANYFKALVDAPEVATAQTRQTADAFTPLKKHAVYAYPNDFNIPTNTPLTVIDDINDNWCEVRWKVKIYDRLKETYLRTEIREREVPVSILVHPLSADGQKIAKKMTEKLVAQKAARKYAQTQAQAH